jgi:hypothetical protein
MNDAMVNKYLSFKIETKPFLTPVILFAPSVEIETILSSGI